MKFFSQKLLAFSFIVPMLMVCLEVTPWLALFSVTLLICRWGIDKCSWKPWSAKVTGILSVLLFLQVLFEYRTIIGQEPAFHFLLGLAALKVMDFKNSRDHKFLVLLGFILVAVKALFNIDIYWLIPSLISLVGLWYSLFPPHVPRKNIVLVKVIAVSLPLLIFLFLAFPRVSVPWMLPRGQNTGKIGFSDQMNPGSVASIASRPGAAFRAKIGALPFKKISDLYWRGVVLNSSQGLSWRLGPQAAIENLQQNPSQGEYEVSIEPSDQSYLFVLPGTGSVDLSMDKAISWEGGVFRSRRPLNKNSFYRGKWSEDFYESVDSPERYLRHPKLQPRVQKLVDEFMRTTSSQADRLNKLKKFFSDSGFAYTLSPGNYRENDIETFIFERRLGFCEHYAGAYATLARALRVPARVVLGYQGGVYNPLGDFWKISHRDAHAWVEVAENGRWKAIDPTSWIAPLRLAVGGESFFSLSEEDQRAFSKDINWSQKKNDWQWIEDLGFRIEDINYRWNNFLLEYDQSLQILLFKDLSDNPLFFFGPLVFAVFAVIWLFRSLLRSSVRLDSGASILLQVIEGWGAQRGFLRSPQQSPMEYFADLARSFPEYKKELTEISDFYDQTLYRLDQKNHDGYRVLLQQWKKKTRNIKLLKR